MTTDEFIVEVEQVDVGILVRLGGELDLGVADRLEAALREAERSNAPTVVLDLRELRFLDSTGLRTIVAAHGRVSAQGRRLVVVRGPHEVHRVFELTRFDERLEMVDEPPQAA